MKLSPKALTLDLFGTIVLFDESKLPRHEVNGEQRIDTLPNLEEILSPLDPVVAPDAFRRIGMEVSKKLTAEKERTHIEVSSVERFRRAIVEAGMKGPVDDVAKQLTETHMSYLKKAVFCPDDRIGLLDRLRRRYRLALISNFDYTPTAEALLDDFNLTQRFDEILISDTEGICKPSSEIFARACGRLGVEAEDTLHVGDSARADIAGATTVGMATIWISADAALAKKHDIRPDAVVRDLAEIEPLLD